MSNIYFMCENCGIETNGITLVNGMKFCAKCYHQIFGKDNQQTEITQLKQQLAEKEKEINSLIVDYEKRISQEQELMSNMEHRLTEKQNEIDEINKEFVQATHDWKALCAEKDKEKTQLAIQELEKVKEKLDKEIIIISNFDEMKKQLKYLVEILVYIQQRIKELKGEKE